jgi:hypothetical protein
MKNMFHFLLIMLACIIGSINGGCNNNQYKKINDKNIEEGYRLSQIHCKGCHQLPDPMLLNKATWANFVLPKMGEFAGFRYLGQNHYVENGTPAALKLNQWNNIVQYFETQSPVEPIKGKAENIKIGLNEFSVRIPSFGVQHPSTTMVLANKLNKGFFFGDGVTQQLYLIQSGNLLVDSFSIGKGISNLHINGDSLIVLTMGVLQPSDSKAGKLTYINKSTKKSLVILDSLQRPVNASYADFNQDKLEDIVVCEFGNLTGQLGWYQNTGNNKFIKHPLRPLPGAIHTEVYDFNKDGKPDIIAVMAQGDEGVFIYYNQGDNIFKEESVIQLPPSYGSNYLELSDFNKDGYMDIITTNGDNGDYPPILKAYHGIRIYLNDGNNRFKEKLFLHMNGVGKVIAKDFDFDGDIDLASISFFCDYTKIPGEGFIYWENKGNLLFQPFSFNDLNSGRWLTMDAGDIDADGDIDIILGNANFFMATMPDFQKKKLNLQNPSVLILENIHNSK